MLPVTADFLAAQFGRMGLVRIDHDGGDAGPAEHGRGGRPGEASSNDGDIGVAHDPFPKSGIMTPQKLKNPKNSDGAIQKGVVSQGGSRGGPFSRCVRPTKKAHGGLVISSSQTTPSARSEGGVCIKISAGRGPRRAMPY